jgi:hypothetical protein
MLESLGLGVLEYWSVEKKASILSSLLQYSSTPLLRNQLKLKAATMGYLLLGYRSVLIIPGSSGPGDTNR